MNQSKALARSTQTAFFMRFTSPLPSASVCRRQDDCYEKKMEMVLTRVAGLADLATTPVEIVAFAADPVTWLLFGRAFVTGVNDGRVLLQTTV